MKIAQDGATLQYSTLLGGSEWDWVQSVGVDREASVYVAGTTASSDLPVVRPIQSSPHGLYATFFQKLDAEATAILQSSYLGGGDTLGNQIEGLHVDPSGRLYLAGTTSDPGFPLRNPLQSAMPPGAYDCGFVARVDPQGTLAYSTY